MTGIKYILIKDQIMAGGMGKSKEKTVKGKKNRVRTTKKKKTTPRGKKIKARER